MKMAWSFSDDRPIYSQIIEQIKQFIVSGEIKPGDKLASVRDMASEAGVNPNTMQRALSELERTGLIYSQRTSGRYITQKEELIQDMKNELANEKINMFLQSMQQIGYSKEQVADLIKNYKEAENK